MEDLEVPEYYPTVESTIGIPKHYSKTFDSFFRRVVWCFKKYCDSDSKTIDLRRQTEE